MSGRVFWVMVAVLLGIAVHLAYVLFVPLMQMDSKIKQFAALAGTNRLAVIGPAARAKVLPEADPALAEAVCVFDLSAGPVEVKAKIPLGYWLVSFFASNGDSFYSLNGRQAEVRSLDLVIVPDKGGSKTAGAGTETGTGSRITVRSPSSKGLVLLRARVPEAAMRARVEADLAASACARAG